MSKKLMAAVLAVFMLLGTVTPAIAVSDGTPGPVAEPAVSGQGAAQTAGGHVPLATGEKKDAESALPDIQADGGGFPNVTVTPAEDPGIDLTQGLMGPQISEARHDPAEIVRVIVVFEDDSLFDRGFTAEDIQKYGAEVMSARTDLELNQDAILENIRTAVLESIVSQDIPVGIDAEPMEINYRYGVLLNGASLSVPYCALNAIREVNGVKDAFLARTYTVPIEPDDSYSTYTFTTSETTGATQVWDETGYAGKGMRIAIIDTGLDLDHPSFSDESFKGDNDLTVEEIADALPKLNAAKIMPGLTAESLYHSKKIPYTFNYADGDLDVGHEDGQGDHGTHVAGIAAANKLDTTTAVGVAPDAQIVVMRVFPDPSMGGGASQDDIYAALEDCFYLGVDVANMSLGSDAGFSESGNPTENEIYASVAEHGMVLAVAAGNSTSSAQGNLNGQNKNKTSDPDNSIVSSPATYKGVTAVASSENGTMMMPFVQVGEDKIPYNDIASQPFYTLAGYDDTADFSYIVIPGNGDTTDYEDEDVQAAIEIVEAEGGRWIALVQRGVIDFTRKQTNAADAGAAGVIIYDNAPGDLLYMQDAGVIPNIFITLADGEKMVKAAQEDEDGSEILGTLTVNAVDYTPVENPSSGKMSDFSSWGLSPDLTLTPDITAPGGHIYSTLDGGIYGDMSGTSMATPELAGMAALVLQYLDAEHPEFTEEARHDVAEALLMSTATPVIETKDGAVPYSPRLQGAGLANVYKAVTSPAYLTVEAEGADRVTPKASLGDSEEGTYTFTFKINNLTDKELTYDLSSTLLTDQFNEVNGVKYMGETSRLLTDSTVKFSGTGVEGDTVTVPANGKIDVTVSVTLGTEDKKYMDDNYENGIYVDGFVRLTHSEGDESSVDLGLPFVGFYGDWSDAPLFDEGWMYESTPSGEKYYTNAIFGYYLMGANPYTGDTAHVRYVTSPNGDGFFDVLDAMYIGQMRSAKMLTFTWTDADGKVIGRPMGYQYAKKTVYNASYGFAFPTVLEADFSEVFATVEDGGCVYLTIEGYLDDGDDVADDVLVKNLPVYVDTTAPKVEVVGQEDGKLKLKVYDNTYIAAIMPLDATGSGALEYYTVEEAADAKPGQEYTVEIDLAGLEDTFTLAVGDYGVNETYITVTLQDKATFDPNSWYVYRYYSWLSTDYGMTDTDMYNGWWTFKDSDIPEADEMAFRNSTLIDAAADVTAAEYVDGYLFGIEQTGEDEFGIPTPAKLFAIRPGRWTRMPIADLEDLSYTTDPAFEGDMGETVYLNAIDMTFDHHNNTLYVLTQADPNGTQMLVTIDPNTGDIDKTVDVSHDTELLTLAADNEGVLYTIDTDAEDASLYTLDPESGELSLIGDTGVSTGLYEEEYDYETGEAVSKLNGYFQTMAFDHDKEDTLYWLSYNTDFDGMTYQTSVFAGLFMVDPTSGEAEIISNVLYDGEFTGLTKVYDDDDDDTVVNDNAPLETLTLTEDFLAMRKGSESVISALPTPFNANTDDLTWDSSDEDVATVERGVVTAVGAGTAVITASAGDVEAQCEVLVVAPEGDLRVFDAAGLYQWIEMDGAKIEEDQYMPEGLSPSFAITAAAYHNGRVYAYDASGVFYSLDPDTMNGVKIGRNSDSGTITAMSFNYSDGFMYGLKETTIGDGWFGTTVYSLTKVNMNTGATEDVAGVDLSAPFVGMAIDTDGTFYFIVMDDVSYEGYLMYKAELAEGELTYESCSGTFAASGAGYGSLVYSDANKGFFWANDMGQLIFIDGESYTPVYLGSVFSFELEGYSMSLGLVEIPETEHDTPKTSAESATMADEFLVLAGGSVAAPVDVEPWNSTDEITYEIADTTVATVDDGIIHGLRAGTTTLTANVGGLAELTATVKVLPAAGDGALHGIAIQDFAANAYGYWFNFSDLTPDTVPDDSNIDNADLYFNETTSVFAGTYYDGTIYAYAQCSMDGGLIYGNYFLTFDVGSGYAMDVVAPVHYQIMDMAVDYTTGALYAVDSTGNLLQIDPETGAAYVIGNAGVGLVAATFDKDGELYAISMDGMLYSLDKATGEATAIGSTGKQSCTGYQSLCYDLNTGNTYWSYMNLEPLDGGLCLVDLETGVTTELGAILGGMMVGALYTVPAKTPDVLESTEPTKVLLDQSKAVVAVGETLKLTATVLPIGRSEVDDTVTWSSANSSVATVEDGTVTGVTAGTTTVTVTDTAGNSATCTVTVTEHPRQFFAYDETHGQWVTFDSTGAMQVVCEDAPGDAVLKATFYVQEENVIYGFDEEGNFYSIDPDTYDRTFLGKDTEAFAPYESWDGSYDTFPVDLAYDAASKTLYVATAAASNDPYSGYYFAHGAIYSVDTKTGSCTQVFNGEDSDMGEISFANLIVVDGVAYTLDAFDSSILTSIDLDTGVITKIALPSGYWSEPTSSRSFFTDELTGTIYAVRDFAGGGIYGNGTDPEPVLYTFNLNDASIEEVMPLGAGAVLNGVNIREAKGIIVAPTILGEPSVTTSDGAFDDSVPEETKEAIAEALAQTTPDATDIRDAIGSVVIPEETVEEAKAALEKAGIPVDDTPVRVVAETYLDVTLENYSEEDGNKTLALEIDAYYHLIATTAAEDEDIVKSGADANAVVLGNEDEPIDINSKLTLTVGLPAGFTDKDSIFVTHEKNRTHLHKAEVIDNDGALTAVFTSTDGLSPFTISTANTAEAMIGDVYYATLAEAVAAVRDGETITLVSNVTLSGNITVSRTVSFVIDLGGNTITGGSIVPGSGYYNDSSTANEYRIRAIVYSYSITVEPVDHATVTVSSESAVAGTQITVTVKTEENYHVFGLTVSANGANVPVTDNKDGTYTFTMPSGSVTVSAKVLKCPSMDYSDLELDAWYHTYTDTVIAEGLMTGMGAGVFSPSGTVTRAQMVTTLWNYAGKPQVNYLLPFTDVTDGKWYTEAVRWAASEGIVTGYSETHFGPSDPVTRAQAATIIYRYEQKQGGGFTDKWMFKLPFTDLTEIPEWSVEAMAWCSMKGVILGRDDGSADPTGLLKRSELAAILARYITLEK